MLPERYRGSIVSFRNDRMGARILALMNAVRIARDYELPYYFTWMTHGRTSPELQSPTEIFDQGWFDAHFVSHVDFSAIDGVATNLASLPLRSTSDLILQTCAKGGGFLCMNTDLAVLPWENAEEIAPRYAAAIDELQMSDAIKAAMKAVDQLLSGPSTAFHLRRGDIIHDPVTSNQLWSNKYIPREFYEIMATRLVSDPKARILVFSDEPAEIARLKSLGDQIISPDEVLPENLTLAQRDFMEIYAMARCEQILGPPGSGFSMAAGLMGNTTVTDIRGCLTDDENAAAMDLLTERLEARSDIFISPGDVGQSLPFACEHLNATRRQKQALALLEGYAGDGFNKLYFFRLHLMQQMKCETFDRYDDVLQRMKTAELDRGLPARLDQHWSELSRLASLLAWSGGNIKAARHYMAMAFWYGGSNRLVYSNFSLLLSDGAIDPETFPLPFDPTIRRPVPQAAERRASVDGSHKLAALSEVIPPDILVRDWRLFMGKTLNRGFDTEEAIARALELFNLQFARYLSPGSLASVRGVYAAELGDMDSSQAQHNEALAENGNNPLFLKRMAATLLKAEPESRIARTILEKAADLGKQSLYTAELAQCIWSQGEKASALTLMRKASSGSDVLPEAPFLTGRMMRHTGQVTEETLALMDQALDLAPHVRRFMIQRVHVLSALGRMDDARDAIEEIVKRFGLGGDIAALRSKMAA